MAILRLCGSQEIDERPDRNSTKSEYFNDGKVLRVYFWNKAV